jgi:hypothetical protein
VMEVRVGWFSREQPKPLHELFLQVNAHVVL